MHVGRNGNLEGGTHAEGESGASEDDNFKRKRLHKSLKHSAECSKESLNN